MLYTTLKLLRERDACSGGLSTLIASLPAKHSESEEISLAHILKSNGLEHAIWALRATTVDARKIAGRMIIDFAYQTLDNFEKRFPEDKWPRTALEKAIAFLDGKITCTELNAAESAESAELAELAWLARLAVRSAWLPAAESTWLAWLAELAESAESAESAELAELAWLAWLAWLAVSAESAESAELAELAWLAVRSAWLAVRSAWLAESEQEPIFRKWVSK